jgi:hypothetical protein
MTSPSTAASLSRLSILLYLLYAAAVSWLCFVRPFDNLDRYLYEAVVRARSQPLETVYRIVKHESPRTEASSVLDSAVHLGQLEPLYAIKPMYVQTIAVLSDAGIPIQRSITLLSAFSLFGIAVVLLIWTKRPLYCAILMVTPEVVALGRLGTPDAMSALTIVAACWALMRNFASAGIFLLLLSVWVRTDNLLVAVLALAWLTWERRLSLVQGLVLVATALGSVFLIHHFSGNYSWAVLFRFSFVAGRSPAEVPAQVTVEEYLRAFEANLQTAAPHLAVGLLFGVVAWRHEPRYRPMLFAVVLAALGHFLLYPSPEARYLAWAYLISGTAFITAMNMRPLPSTAG